MQKTIRVTIHDGGAEKTFSVRLFGAMEGLDFIDRLMQSGATPSLKNIAGDLLPLATLIGPDGKAIDEMSITRVDTYFESPLAVLELAYKVFRHQMGFMKESALFRGLIPKVEELFNFPTSDSATPSAT